MWNGRWTGVTVAQFLAMACLPNNYTGYPRTTDGPTAQKPGIPFEDDSNHGCWEALVREDTSPQSPQAQEVQVSLNAIGGYGGQWLTHSLTPQGRVRAIHCSASSKSLLLLLCPDYSYSLWFCASWTNTSSLQSNNLSLIKQVACGRRFVGLSF